jgi:hypothetical protein
VSSGSGTSVADEWVQVAWKDWRRAERNLKDRDSSHQVHYLRRPFQREPAFHVSSVNYNFPELLARAEAPR